MDTRIILKLAAALTCSSGGIFFLIAVANSSIEKGGRKHTSEQFLDLAKSGVLILMSIALSLLAR
jgi:hypothetical protein